MSTISVNTDSYAPWGTTTGEASRPERNHEAEALAARYFDPDIQRDYRLSDEDYAYVKTLPGYPPILGTSYGGRRTCWMPMGRATQYRDREKVTEYFAKLRGIFGAK